MMQSTLGRQKIKFTGHLSTSLIMYSFAHLLRLQLHRKRMALNPTGCSVSCAETERQGKVGGNYILYMKKRMSSS